MTQVTQLIIPLSSDRQISNLIRGIIDITKNRPATAETIHHIESLAEEAIAMMESRQQPVKPKRGGGF
ncbi:hypothetical protein [Pantoea ananatis]|uniref:hypothetical protein n=1 Tax=Pantoea ananas TaxID=553 RepID=UPI0025C7EF7F|nr:hypothetical protein [Pantoea ananatis]MDN4131892.1 hypothetical protein [Pantoea ananatis]